MGGEGRRKRRWERGGGKDRGRRGVENVRGREGEREEELCRSKESGLS